MTSKPDGGLQLGVWMEEYKSLDADIRARVDLQQKNLTVFVVLVSAFTGYLANYLARYGYASLLRGPTVLTLAVLPVLSLLCVWRHVDHDANIADKADYIWAVLRPRVNALAGADDLLAFEGFLRARRRRRPVSVGVLAFLGLDHMVILAYTLAFLGTDWYLRLGPVRLFGPTRELFDSLLYAATGLAVATTVMVAKVSTRYLSVLGGDPSHGHGGPVPAGAPDGRRTEAVPAPVPGTAPDGPHPVPRARTPRQSRGTPPPPQPPTAGAPLPRQGTARARVHPPLSDHG